jgi:uncharacterized protein (TIGR00251 family)
MAEAPKYVRETEGGVLLALKVQPRAALNEISGVLGGELKIKVTAPPVDSAANGALIKFLAEKLNCGRNRVEIVRGNTSRHKTVKIHGFTVKEITETIGFKA